MLILHEVFPINDQGTYRKFCGGLRSEGHSHDSLHRETDDLSALTLTGFVVKWEQNPHLMRRNDDKEAKK